jgi:hypothetical protein
MKIVYTLLGRIPEGKRPLGRATRRWEGNIWNYLKGVVCLSQDRVLWRALVNTVVKGGKFLFRQDSVALSKSDSF